MSHGGKRAGAGRPRVEVDEKRVRTLRAQGLTRVQMAERLGISRYVLARVLKTSEVAALPLPHN